MKKKLLDDLRIKYTRENDFGSEMFLKMLLDYYTKNDLETGDQLSKIFFALYISCDHLTYDELVLKFNISYITLYRYRRRFNRFAELMLPQLY